MSDLLNRASTIFHCPIPFPVPGVATPEMFPSEFCRSSICPNADAPRCNDASIRQHLSEAHPKFDTPFYEKQSGRTRSESFYENAHKYRSSAAISLSFSYGQYLRLKDTIGIRDVPDCRSIPSRDRSRF